MARRRNRYARESIGWWHRRFRPWLHADNCTDHSRMDYHAPLRFFPVWSDYQSTARDARARDRLSGCNLVGKELDFIFGHNQPLARSAVWRQWWVYSDRRLCARWNRSGQSHKQCCLGLSVFSGIDTLHLVHVVLWQIGKSSVAPIQVYRSEHAYARWHHGHEIIIVSAGWGCCSLRRFE